MYTRFALKSSPKYIGELFQVEQLVEWNPRYNVSPSQTIPVVTHTLEEKKRILKLLHWGFVASWSQGGRLLANIRCEEIGERPILEESFEKWRCLIPVDGFYEWRHEAKETQPYYFRLKNRQPFALAGLWAPQKLAEETREVCAILTTTPNEVVRVIHDRMPVILEKKDYDVWLDSEVRDFRVISRLFRPFDAEKMEGFQVSGWVNILTHDGEKCIERSDETDSLH